MVEPSANLGWAAIALAALTMGKNIADSIIARRTTKDKLEQDVKVALLTEQHRSCESGMAKMETALVECKEQHKQSELDRREMREDIVELQRKFDSTQPPKSGTRLK
jgi:hypothetical protein